MDMEKDQPKKKDEFAQSMTDGVNHDKDAILKFLEDMHKSYKSRIPQDDGNLRGLQNIANQKAKGYADGGMVEPEAQAFTDQGAFDKIRGWITAQNTPPIDPVQDALKTTMPKMPSAAVQANQAMGGGPEAYKQALEQGRSDVRAAALPGAIGGIGDAFIRSAGGQSSFMNDINNRAQGMADRQVAGVEKTQDMQKEQFNLQQKLEAQNPGSDLSKQAQQTYGPLLTKLGFKPQDIMNMPASLIADLTGKTVEQVKAEAEAKLAGATLGLNTQKAAEDARHNVAGEEVAKGNLAAKDEAARQEAATTLSHRGPLQRITDWVSPSAETKVLQQTMEGATPEAHGIPELGSTFNGQLVKKVTRID